MERTPFRNTIEINLNIRFWPDYVGSGWTAVEEGYDAEPDGETGRLCSKSPIGRGQTSREAIQDLLDQLEDQI